MQDKKPKLYDAGAGTAATGVLADRPNDAQLDSPAQLTPAERSYSLKLKRQMEQWESVIADLHAQPLPRTPDWYKSYDQANAGLLAVKTPYEALKKRGDAAPPGLAGATGTPKPKPQAPRPQLKPAIVTPNNATGAAAMSAALTKNGFTCSAAAPPAVKQHFKDYPQSASIAFPDWVKLDVGAVAGRSGAGGVAFPELAGKGDLTGATLDALSTFNTGARAGADDVSDDEDRMWGQLAPLRTEDFDHFVKKAIEGEGFEGNLNVLNAAQNIGLTNITDKVPHMTVKLLPHQVRVLLVGGRTKRTVRRLVKEAPRLTLLLPFLHRSSRARGPRSRRRARTTEASSATRWCVLRRPSQLATFAHSSRLTGSR